MHREGADVPATQAAGELGSSVQIHWLPRAAEADPAGEKRDAVLIQAAEGEDIGILQEEIPFFGKEQGEATQIDLPVIHFGGGEIRIKGQCARQGRRELVAYIQRRLQHQIGVIQDEILSASHRERRDDIEPHALLQSFESMQHACRPGIELAVIG